MKKTKSGFTLIELLIVVAIIGILAAIAVPNFLNAQTRARVARVVSDLKALATAEEMYFLDHNSYTNESEHYIFKQYPDDRPRADAGLYFLIKPVAYIGSLPNDPFENKFAPTAELAGIDAYEMAVAPRDPEPFKRLYNMNSRGTDLDEDMGARSGLEGGTAIKTYDPSNGTISDGDIYIWGGNTSVMKGNIIVDGKNLGKSLPPNPSY